VSTEDSSVTYEETSSSYYTYTPPVTDPSGNDTATTTTETPEPAPEAPSSSSVESSQSSQEQ
jgi:hypothetical protein